MLEFEQIEREYSHLPTEREKALMEYLISRNGIEYPYYEVEDFRIVAQFEKGVLYWYLKTAESYSESLLEYAPIDLQYLDGDGEEAVITLILANETIVYGFALWRIDGKQVRRYPDLDKIQSTPALEFDE